MFRSVLFLAAVVLFSGIYAEEVSKTVVNEEAGKTVVQEDASKTVVQEDAAKTVVQEDASKTVVQEDSGKSVRNGESPSVSPAHVVDNLNPDPEDFLNRGKNYTFYCDAQEDFVTAWRKCLDLHLELATIESAADDLAFEAALGSYAAQVWTSGTDMGKEGSFVWLTNQRPIPSIWNNFEAWETGEPNNSGIENCLVGIIKGGRVQWNDVSCDNKYCYMCQDILT